MEELGGSPLVTFSALGGIHQRDCALGCLSLPDYFGVNIVLCTLN